MEAIRCRRRRRRSVPVEVVVHDLLAALDRAAAASLAGGIIASSGLVHTPATGESRCSRKVESMFGPRCSSPIDAMTPHRRRNPRRSGYDARMRLPAALLPLRNATFRGLWLANVVAWLGTWLQNTGAGWLMTSLAPQPFIVAMVQAATIMPVFLLALPGGALADIVDRRVFLIGTQVWTIVAATALAILTLTGAMTAFWLLALTFAIGIGAALTGPAWSAIVPELVPREDLVQAIALNGIGFNLTRAIGPALGGMLILIGGSSLAFSLYAVSIIAVLSALFTWRRGRRFTGLPREHLLSAMRAGVRFVRNTPAVQYAMVRTIAYSIPASAPWALLPLLVREHLGLGPGMYGVILGMMGIGGVTSGMLLPLARGRITRGTTVIGCSLFSCAGIALLGATHHWLPAAFGMLLFGVGWTSAYATIQTAAQLVCPPWVRARALAIYQLAQNGALTAGSVAWGTLGGHVGLAEHAAGGGRGRRRPGGHRARLLDRSFRPARRCRRRRQWQRNHCECPRRPPPN